MQEGLLFRKANGSSLTLTVEIASLFNAIISTIEKIIHRYQVEFFQFS